MSNQEPDAAPLSTHALPAAAAMALARVSRARLSRMVTDGLLTRQGRRGHYRYSEAEIRQWLENKATGRPAAVPGHSRRNLLSIRITDEQRQQLDAIGDGKYSDADVFAAVMRTIKEQDIEVLTMAQDSL